jgi:hypothetical protein
MKCGCLLVEKRRNSETAGLIYFRKAEEAGFNGLQSLADLRQNWNQFMDPAGLNS